MNHVIRTVIVLISICGICDASAVRTAVKELIEVTATKTASQATTGLAKLGGRSGVTKIVRSAFNEGGDHLVRRLVHYGKHYGTDAVAVIGRSPKCFVTALDAVPTHLTQSAIWAANRNPQLMTKLVRDHGSEALIAAIKHPGIGERLVTGLGTDGIRLSRALQTDDALRIAKHLDELQQLPSAARSQWVDRILAAPAKTAALLEKHPRLLAASAGAGVLIASKDNLFGPAGVRIVHPDGTIEQPAPGFVERVAEPFTDQIQQAAGMTVYAVLGVIGVTLIWYGWTGIQGIRRIRGVFQRLLSAGRSTRERSSV